MFNATVQIIDRDGVHTVTLDNVAPTTEPRAVIIDAFNAAKVAKSGNDTVAICKFDPPRIRAGDRALHIATFWITEDDIVDGVVQSAHTTGRLLYELNIDAAAKAQLKAKAAWVQLLTDMGLS